MSDQNAKENGVHTLMRSHLRRRIKTQSTEITMHTTLKKVPMDFTVEVVGKVVYGWSRSLDATHWRFKRG